MITGIWYLITSRGMHIPTFRMRLIFMTFPVITMAEKSVLR
jgi:hypothetical protein